MRLPMWEGYEITDNELSCPNLSGRKCRLDCAGLVVRRKMSFYGGADHESAFMRCGAVKCKQDEQSIPCFVATKVIER